MGVFSEKDIEIKERKKKIIIESIIACGLDIAYDNESNFGDVYIEDNLNYIIEDLGFEDYTMIDLIEDIEKDKRVKRVAGICCDEILDIVFTDKAVKEYNNEFCVPF